jgi:hypothetical protein
MGRNQKNFEYFDYLDDNGAHWNVRGESGGALHLVDGHAVFNPANAVFGRISSRRHPRYAVFQDPTTLRTIRGIIYTPTAYAAIAPGDTVAVQVPGLATTVSYRLLEKLPERLPRARASRNLPDS